MLLDAVASLITNAVFSACMVNRNGATNISHCCTFFRLQGVVTSAANSARRLESFECSRFLQHVAEARGSLTVIRSFGAEQRFARHCYRLVDAAARALLGFVDCVRTMRFAGGLCGLIVTLPTMVFALHRSGHSTDVVDNASTVGLALSTSMGVS